ncbi:predicted protein [Uncinocarpus reesii 1704]|uniref:Late endosomal/lysosomal adaptor and MAPK and MTOR activator-domain-containing protein n=1 Tax=Uncinocarpus reesii (strain UAMH 1704) TaxID=336963 RepID=C4JGD8_UNCRE|nr:uncharacterized protein UREG_01129 [Uncinocarpus reesii 1704]EEP76280.1 predicted protein [Uncinocarpus reesii 1704]
MGICASCLGFGRRDSHDSESARLLDDEIYQPGYSYGTVQAQRHGPDPEDLKREREALDAICQRISDSVIDIWTVQSQPLMASTRSPNPNATASSSRVPSNERNAVHSPISPKPEYSSSPVTSPSRHNREDRSPSPIPGEIAGMKYVPCRDAGQITNLSTIPRHWGEVVVTNRRERKKRPGIIGPNDDVNGQEGLFGALVVK